LRQWGPQSYQSVVAFAALKLRRTRFDLEVSAWLRHAKTFRAVACQAVARGHNARLRLSASARQPSLASRAKAGAGGGTRTHTTLPSRDFKSLASTSSATSALLIPLAFSSQAGKCFPIDSLRFPF